MIFSKDGIYHKKIKSPQKWFKEVEQGGLWVCGFKIYFSWLDDGYAGEN